MSIEREIDRCYRRIMDPRVAGDMLIHGGYAKPLEAAEIGDVIRRMDPADWGLAVQNARQAMMETRARNGLP